MEIIDTIETAVGTAVAAIEHPFHTIGERLKAIAGHLTVFGGHPYAAPPLQDALTALHGVVVDLAQEVAELRTPCPCKPAPTGAITNVAVDTAAPAAPLVWDEPQTITLGAADAADFRQWQAAKAGAASFTG